MSGRLEGRVAWVTGAGRGLGRAIALAYAAEGADLVLTARSRNELEEVAEQAVKQGRRVCVAPADLRDTASVGRAVEAGVAALGPIDVLVNNAGLWFEKPFLDIDEAEWRGLFEVNVHGIYRCTRAVLPSMIERRSGRIIQVASIDGQVGFPNLTAPCASKAAVIGFTRALAKEMWQHGVAVTAICPAEVDKTVGWGEEPAHRPGAPSVKLVPADVARAAVFLASRDAEAITGVTLDVYGIGFLAS